MSFTSWLKNLRSALTPSRGQRHHRRPGSLRATTHRPNLEVLEDRCVPAFLPPVYYDVAAGPIAVVTADFNGDGHLDLATASLHAYPDVSVLLGNGDGTFQAAQYNAVGTFGSIAVGDFNGDGNPDLVIGTLSGPGAGDYSYGAVAVYFGNGDGGFQIGSTFLTDGADGGLTVGVAVADFDADGKLDLAVTSDYGISAGVLVMLGRGDGTFAARGSYVVDTGTQSVVTGDFNLDGKVDLAWIHPYSGQIGVHLGNGDGTFSAAQFVATDDFPVSVNLAEAVGDFNGDGRWDMAVAFYEDNSVSVLLDDGDGPPPPPSLRINDVTVAEGNTGTVAANFTVTLSAASTEAITIAYATGNGTGTAGSDYLAASGTLTFAPGETSKIVTVPVNGDRLGESNETFVVNLSGATNATIGDGQGIGTILDDEPRISINDVTVTEGNTGAVNATFTVSLSVAYDVAVTVHYQTANGSATAGSDYAAASGDVIIAAGQITKTFTVAVIGDRSAEPTENFVVNVSAATNGLIVDSQGVGTILDNEPRISISDVTKAEGRKNHTTLFTFTVTLSAAYDQPVTMSFRTTDGTAKTSDNDYIARTGTLTFAPGETTKTITIEVKGDSKRESNETFYLDLFGNSGNSLLTKNRGTGTILNDD